MVAADARTFVVNRTAVQLLSSGVAVAEVLSVARFVAKTPHHNASVVAVAKNEAVDAVYECRNPRFAIGDSLVGVVFKVGFVAAV